MTESEHKEKGSKSTKTRRAPVELLGHIHDKHQHVLPAALKLEWRVKTKASRFGIPAALFSINGLSGKARGSGAAYMVASG